MREEGREEWEGERPPSPSCMTQHDVGTSGSCSATWTAPASWRWRSSLWRSACMMAVPASRAATSPSMPCPSCRDGKEQACRVAQQQEEGRAGQHGVLATEEGWFCSLSCSREERQKHARAACTLRSDPRRWHCTHQHNGDVTLRPAGLAQVLEVV